MDRFIIGSLWDRSNRNGANKNFEHLFEDSKRVVELNNRADDVLIEAQKTNDMNKTLKKEIDKLEELYTSDEYFIKYWEIGAISSEGIPYDNSTRVRSDYIKSYRGMILNALSSDSKGAYIVEYDNNKNFIKNINYTNQYLSNNDGYIRVMTGFKNDSEISSTTYFEDKFEILLNTDNGNNLYNAVFGNEYRLNLWALGTIENTEGKTVPSSTRLISDFLKVERGMKVKIDNPDGAMIVSVATYDKDKKYEMLYSNSNDYTFFSDGYAKIITGYSDNKVISDITPFLNKVSIIGASNNTEIKKEITVGETLVDGWSVGSIDHTGVSTSSSNRIKTDYIKAPTGTKFYINDADLLKGLYLVQYDENKNHVKQYLYSSSHVTDVDGFVKLITGFKDERTINGLDFIENKVFAKVMSKSNNHYLFGDFSTYYVSETATSVTTTDEFNLEASVIDDVYAEYDSMMAENQSIMTRNLLGYGGDESNIADTTLPIYEYVIRDLDGRNEVQTESPTILLLTGIHGDEKSTVWSTVQFIKQLLTNWHTKDNLESILSNVNLKIIPIANPSGYNANTRVNLHGVDLNRNFSYRWESFPTENYNKGSAPYSELETQIIRDWMIANNDALAFIDYHNVFSRYHITYLDTPNKSLHKIYSSQLRRMSNRWYRKYGVIQEATEGQSQGVIIVDQDPMSFQEGIIQGIEYSTIIEVARDFNGVQFTSEVIERGVEVIGNYILGLLDAYSKNFIE